MKIEFFSTIAGVTEMFPILPAKQVIPKWVSEARNDYMKSDKKNAHVFRCPGIIDLMSTGFIVSAWHDINIDITPEKINVSTPDEMLNRLSGKPPVNMQERVAQFFPKRPWSQKHILKINTPWNVLAPKNLKFMFIPIPYSDYLDFEATPGILDPSIASDINIQGYMNKTIGNIFIKAGTPICQLIPITEKSYSMVCRDMTPKDELWFKKKRFFDSCTFVLQRNKIKEAYNNFMENR